MPTISRRRALAYAAVLLTLLAVGGRLALDDDGSAEPTRPALVSAEPAPTRTLLVHVVGAVRSPGLYRLRDGSRVDDALRKAGGPRPKAALELVNLAAPVADGQQVIVPLRAKGTSAAASAIPPAAGSAGAPPTAPVSLNSATLEQLDALPGIGPVTAQKILDYRAANGAFSSIEELDAVSGIGPARLEQLKPLVTL